MPHLSAMLFAQLSQLSRKKSQSAFFKTLSKPCKFKVLGAPYVAYEMDVWGVRSLAELSGSIVIVVKDGGSERAIDHEMIPTSENKSAGIQSLKLATVHFHPQKMRGMMGLLPFGLGLDQSIYSCPFTACLLL